MTELFPLVLEGACTRRGGKDLAGPVDLRLEGQGASIIIGPNGSGKTSLLRLIHGAARLSAGTITWACPTDTARHHQAFVFQRPVMLRRSVAQNIAYPLRLRGVGRRAALDQARDWGVRVGLADCLDLPAPVLSGGEQQKLALARALITEPRVLFLDEPCAALDGAATRDIETILADAKAAGTRIIMTTHDIGQARRLADEVIFLLHGRVHDRARADIFFDAPATSEAAAFLRGDIVQ
ncbi:ABC transporter ATP-binding protein [Jannaschia pagri]|uniref:ABC transporter ATP-binding protein n=1 Tax=Jannaschia pagri TaxID=2829797 RepID=A0ABQ4NL82_9RHOB|nr:MULTISPECIES: ATP-binding cassette domain-containing protein [unclassified Jannaschia]GIT91337.1 ABC transporter ATP-binding protein [Jannaschia sp. AI_61]GIT95170.1 ABC transporter ATP-binding protein [Jannaschia sp. AI_62]